METKIPIYKYTHLKNKIIESYETKKLSKTSYLMKEEFFQIYNQIKDLIDSGNTLRLDWKFLSKNKINRTKIGVFLRFCEHIGSCIFRGRKYLFPEEQKDLECYLLQCWNRFVDRK